MIRKTIQWLTLACLALAFTIGFLVKPNVTYAAPLNYTVPGYSSAVVTSSFTASTTAVTAEGTSYDYARYAANGSVVNFGQGTGKKSLSIVGGQRLVVTNTSASGVVLKTVTRELGAGYTSTPALKKYLLFPGQSMKATNLITSSESIDVGGKNSHADYNANDVPNTYDRTHAGGTMTIPAREGIAITNTGTTSYEVLAPYEVFSFASRTNPAVFVKTLQQGQHLEALNVTPYTFTLYFTHKNYDYAIYDAAGVLDSYGHTGYTSDMLTAGRKIIVSNYSDVPLVIEGPYDAIPTKARAYPALYTQTLTSGQSVLVKNTSTESYTLNLKGAYDFAQYSANGSVADYGRKITTTAGTKSIPAGGSIVITKTDGGTAEVVGPPDGFSFTGRTDPALFIGSIAVGQSYEATNRLAGNGTFTMNGLYDYAMYDSAGNINNYYAKRSLGSFSISAGERSAFTNVGSGAAEIIAPYDAFRFVSRANPVSFNKTLVAGETVQADNISLKSFTISLNNQHHYVTYDTGNEVSEFGNPQTADSHIVDDTERIIISNSGTAPIVASGPYDAFRLTDRSAPALYKGFLANGQSLRLTNTSPTLFHLNMSGTYDQASYKTTGEPRSSKRKETSLGQILYNSERITLTGSGSSVLQILTPYDVTLVQSSTNPALAVKELAAGQSAQAKNTSTYNDRVDLTGKHDVMDYDAAGNPDSYARGRTIAYRDVNAGKHVAVMNTGTTAMEVYGPYELFAITSRANPVTFSRVLTANESMELRNQTGKLFPVYSTGLYDLAQYDAANDVTDVEREHDTSVKNVSGLNRLAVTNAQASSMAIEGPYDVFSLSSRANPALFERALAPRQSMEAVFKGTDDASVYMTGKYDYSLFDQNGLKTYARQQNIIKNRLVNTGQRIAVMNTDVQSIVVYGAYDVFDNNARTNPVTFQRTLAPGESFEATNKELTPYEVYPSGLYDFVEFAADQDVRELGRDQTAALEIISSGNRIALTNANSQAITVEGAYDAFQLTNRTNPALFERTLQPGSSFEAAYTGTKDANVKMTGVYDLALYDAAGDIKSYYHERNASIGQAVGVGEKAAIMNSGTSNMVAYGAYDLFQLSNRANPVSFVRTLSGDGTLEIKQKTNKRMSLYLDGTYDHAEYAADGSVNGYGAGATQKEQIISVDAKFVLTPSAAHTVTVSGAYDAFDITSRMIRAVTIKSLDPGASYSLRNISPDSFNLRIIGKYDYQIYDLWGNMQRFGNGSLVNPRVIDSTERMLITNADVAPITVMAPTDAINVTDGGNANEFVKALAIGETLAVKNQSSGASTINLSGKYDYALYDSAGAPVRYLREATSTAISVPAGHKLVITSRNGTGTVVTGGALAFLVTEQEEPALRMVSVSFKNTVELTNISPKAWSFTSSGTMDWASYNSTGTVLGYAARDKAATHELVQAEKMVVTSPLSQSLTIWGPYESFSYVDRTDPALEQETLKADQTVQAKNLTTSTQTLKAGGSFTYRSGSGSEQPGQSPLNVNAGATLLLTNTSGAEYLVFAPFGAIDLSFPGADGTPISGIGAADKVKTLDPSDYDPQTFHADPIDTATGAQIINRTLLTAHGAVPIPFQAQYHSLLTGTGDLGVGWSHNFEMKLEAGANNATVYWNAFRSNVFNKAADGTYSSTDKATRLDHLMKKADGTYVLERNDGTLYRFTAAGRLTEIEEKSGLKLAFGYAADGALTTISDPLTGAALTISYDAAGRVVEVADPAARSVQFSYDAAGRLNEITDAAGNATTYSYDSSNRIVSASSEGVQLFENTYDHEGRVIKQQDAVAGHAPTTFSYEEKDKKLVTTITNRNGDVQKLTHDAQYQLLQTEDSLGNKMTFTYDAQGNRLTATNPLNQTISYAYDDRRNLIRSTDYTGAQVNMTYDNEDNLLSATGPDGNTITYTYDNNNRLISLTDTDGQVTTYAYDAAGMLLSATDPKGAQTSYTYNGGRLVSMNNAAGEVTTYGYDAAGRMASVTDAAGNTSQLVYNADDQLLSDTNALGHAYSYAYDKQGFLASEVDARGNTTHYTYDNNGNLTQVVNALNQASQLIYDAEGRLIEAINPLGDSVKIVYDAVGNVLTQTNAEGESVRYVYDSLYRLVEAYNADNTKVYEVSYDAKGNPVTIKDALNHSQTYVYDELNRLVETIDPMNRSTTFAYDDLNRLTTVSDALKGEASRSYDSLSQVIGYSDPNQNAATYTYDLAGRLIGETNAAGETSTYTYNALGLPDVETNGRGLTTSYNYDAASRLNKFVDQAGEVSYTYDANGNITAVTDGQGKALTRVFDELDRVVQYTDEFGNVIKYSYDAAGNMIMLTYPDNKTVSYTYDRAGRMTSVTDWNGRVTAYSYDANGRLASTLRPNGTTETRTYDAKGQLLTINDIGLDSSIILAYTYGYDAIGNVISENGGP
ncbi:DUF6531 domain-containing protein, partial [Paenibacillus algorifonticola]|uniref:DUF6531 domain-containing protein n=1 Tax=Paenibacillus algorifonticola TaxID=684063 RepID=UPI003D2D6333